MFKFGLANKDKTCNLSIDTTALYSENKPIRLRTLWVDGRGDWYCGEECKGVMETGKQAKR